MTTASSVLKIAAGQIGVCESPAGSNKQKYGKAFGLNGQPWCSIFLWWCCFKAAGNSSLYPKNANAAYAQDEIVSKCSGKWIMKKNKSASTRKAYLKDAKPGDVVTFDFGAMDAYRRHVGIVESVSGNYLICIEGNTSKSGSQSNGGMVVRQRRIYSSICAAVRPAYTGAALKQHEPETITKATLPAYKKGSTYTVQVNDLNVRTGPGTNYRVKKKTELTADGQKHADAQGQLKKGTRVTVKESKTVNGWVWVRIPSGWICAYNGVKCYVK